MQHSPSDFRAHPVRNNHRVALRANFLPLCRLFGRFLFLEQTTHRQQDHQKVMSLSTHSGTRGRPPANRASCGNNNIPDITVRSPADGLPPRLTIPNEPPKVPRRTPSKGNKRETLADIAKRIPVELMRHYFNYPLRAAAEVRVCSKFYNCVRCCCQCQEGYGNLAVVAKSENTCLWCTVVEGSYFFLMVVT